LGLSQDFPGVYKIGYHIQCHINVMSEATRGLLYITREVEGVGMDGFWMLALN